VPRDSFDHFKKAPNTRDQLRGAHDLTLVHDDRSDDDAPTRIQPPLVSCIALFGSASLDPIFQPHPAGTRVQTVPGELQLHPRNPCRKEWHATPQEHRNDRDFNRVDETQIQ
jgi:hypothetical protein